VRRGGAASGEHTGAAGISDVGVGDAGMMATVMVMHERAGAAATATAAQKSGSLPASPLLLALGP
jgi:hypothetical protein